MSNGWARVLKYEAEVADVFGLPEQIRQTVLIPTAYTIGTSFKPAPRQPLDDVLHLDGR